MPTDRLRQIIYSSRASGAVDADAILQASRHNNALDGITGLLWIDGQTIVQVLEGPEESVRATFQRISADQRHADIEILSAREIDDREFSYFSMELAGTLEDEPELRSRISRRLDKLPESLRSFFA